MASVLSSPYIFTMCKEGILAAISIDFLLEIEWILYGEVIHLKAALLIVERRFLQVERIRTQICVLVLFAWVTKLCN